MITSLSSQSAPDPERRNTNAARPAGQNVQLSETIMELAAAVEAQEARIKAVLLEAAEAGDLDLVNRILNLWIYGPVSSVIAQLEASERVQIDGENPSAEEVRDEGCSDVPGVD